MPYPSNDLSEAPYVIGGCGRLGLVLSQTRQLLPVLGIRQEVDHDLRQLLPPERWQKYEQPYFMLDWARWPPDELLF